MDVLLDNRAKKDLKNIPEFIKTRFFNIIETLQKDPLIGIPLSGRLKGYRKVRIGDYRIVYKYYSIDKLLVISRIEPRGKVYKQ